MENLINKYPQHLLEIIDGNQPFEKKLIAAKGMLPLPPSDFVKVLYAFTLDENEQLRSEADNSLIEIPEEVMKSVLSDNETFPEILDFISKKLNNSNYNQSILLNRSTYDSTYAYLAENEVSVANLEIIASNKERILRSVNIVEALSKNPVLSRSVMDEVISFLNLHLQKSDDVIKYIEGIDNKDLEEAVELIEDESLDSNIVDEFDSEESFFDEIDLPEDFLEELEEELKNEEVEDTNLVKKETILQKIAKLNMAEKLKTALLGNSEARSILIRDPNKLISNAVLRNPRITETEIVVISQSKIVSDEILRQISETRKWSKLYQVKLSLVNNPKTPPHISLNFLRHLREVDVKALMWNKNLPGVVTNSARNLYKDSRSKK